MSKGFSWIAQNNSSTDYMRLSVELCKSIKNTCKTNEVCIITDKTTKVPPGVFDHVVVMEHDESENVQWKMGNEWKVFTLSPFTHTIKLEADMLFPSSVDWWWNSLCQHDMIFSYHCRDYQDNMVLNSPYRKLHQQNDLPDVYNGLHYFRRSRWANEFFNICRCIIKNWKHVRDNILINCHEEVPSTDVVYALANKLQDPLQQRKVEYEWFNFIHGKHGINQIPGNRDFYNYLSPFIIKDEIYLGGYRIKRPWHYHKKDLLEGNICLN